MSPAKTVETIAELLTEALAQNPELSHEQFLLADHIAVSTSGFGLLKLTDAAGKLVGFAPDKRPKFLPNKPSVDSAAESE